MDRAALNDISDVQTLRAMVLEQQAVIAQRDQAITDYKHTITQRDHTIAFKDEDQQTHARDRAAASGAVCGQVRAHGSSPA